MRSRFFARVALISLAALAPFTLIAQQGPARSTTAPAAAVAPAQSWADELLSKEGYVSPPKELVDAVLAPRHLNITLSNLSPDKKWFLDEIEDGPVVMKTFSRPFDELGGVFIDYQANRARAITNGTRVGIQMISAVDGVKKAVAIPAGARVGSATWTKDGSAVAYLVHGDDGSYLWITDLATNKPRQISKTPLLLTLTNGFSFSGDGKSIAAVVPPDGRRARPSMPVLPAGPSIKLADSDKNRLRTFPSLMTTQYEFDLLEYHSTGQIALIDVATGAVKKIGAPTMVRSIDFAPDGAYVRVTRMTKPFSYIVPVNSFGQVEEVWDATGKVLTELSKRAINLGAQPDDTPAPDPAAQAGGGGRGGAQQNGKRELAWRTDGPGLTYLEQEPAPANAGGGGGGRANRGGGAGAGGGDAAVQGGGGQGNRAGGGAPQGPPRKDRLMQWLPPFGPTDTTQIFENNTRMTGYRFAPDGSILFFRETTGQNSVDYAVYMNEPATKYAVMRTRGDDFYANPGTMMGLRGGAAGGRGGGGGGRGGGGGGGGPVLMSADGASVYFQGTQYDKNPQQVGPKSFIDQVNIKTGEKKRIYESDNSNVFERVSNVIDINSGKYIVLREGPKTVPQGILVDGANRKQLTNNEDLAPDLTNMQIERFTVERPDGFKFRVTVNLPANYVKGTKLPALFWFYPSEFTTQEAYDQPDRSFNKNAFATFNMRSMEYFTRLGYAVVENDAPIVGPAGQMNNNYVNDLRNDLSATIDELDRRMLVDRTRLAIGGHSYGAFSTVNAMVHTPFFKAGIAGDGAYNRTLTPLGFQTERRDLWEAPNVYMNMSPFMYANNLTGALLMYHGLHDQNVGTDPQNSIRLFHALNGLGKTTALYLYPLEDHGPAARETLLDLWARWAAWLDKYVKNPQPTAPKPAPQAGGGGGR